MITKKISLFTIGLALFTLTLSSCKKEDTVEPTNNAPTTEDPVAQAEPSDQFVGSYDMNWVYKNTATGIEQNLSTVSVITKVSADTIFIEATSVTSQGNVFATVAGNNITIHPQSPAGANAGLTSGTGLLLNNQLTVNMVTTDATLDGAGTKQ